MSYDQTLTRVETYFDKTATKTWERLTSDAPVSKIRETVRQGRDQMRARLLAEMPEDLHGARVLDAGCGAGPTTIELAARGQLDRRGPCAAARIQNPRPVQIFGHFSQKPSPHLITTLTHGFTYF